MPVFKITVKNPINTNGVRLNVGMAVNVVTNSYASIPLCDADGKQLIIDAFKRECGVDLSKCPGCVTTAWMSYEQIG